MIWLNFLICAGMPQGIILSPTILCLLVLGFRDLIPNTFCWPLTHKSTSFNFILIVFVKNNKGQSKTSRKLPTSQFLPENRNVQGKWRPWIKILFCLLLFPIFGKPIQKSVSINWKVKIDHFPSIHIRIV